MGKTPGLDAAKEDNVDTNVRVPRPRPEPSMDELPLLVPGSDEADMLTRLRTRYLGNVVRQARWVYAEQVRNGTPPLRCLDAIAWSTSPADGYAWSGFEIKCSREDVRRELANPEKAAAFLPFLNHFWLVLSDARMLRAGELPSGWGLLVASGYGGLRTEVDAPRRVARPMPLPMQAAFARAAVRTARAAL